MTSDDEIALKREAIRDVDARILELAALRAKLAREIGRAKSDLGLPIRNYGVEAEVIAHTRDVAARLGVRPELAEDLVKLLISESLRVQERERAASRRQAAGSGRRALVVGGRGNMGAWFAEFLDGKGYSVAVADPRGALEGYAFAADDWPQHVDAFDVVCVATPPSKVADVLARIPSSTRALVFDIASLKTPFLKQAESLAAQGVSITSLHPMWGPKTDLLASKNLVICDCGSAEANRAARALFEETAANLVELPIARHDAFMAFTLGLPHATNLVFSRVLARSPFAFADVKHLGGPTFSKQVRVAHEVAGENKDLYFEIQRLNAHSPEVYAAVREALAELERATGSRDAFLTFMQSCQDYYGRESMPGGV